MADSTNAHPPRRRGAPLPSTLPMDTKPAPEVAAAVAAIIPEPTEKAMPRREVVAPPAAKDSETAPPWEKRGPWGAVVASIENVDVQATYERLVKELKLGDGATEYGLVLAGMDRAESNAFEAAKLARLAKLEQERVDLECDSELELLRTTAREELERERAAAAEEGEAEGEGKKKAKVKVSTARFTLQEVEDKVMAGWGTLYRRLRRRKSEAHAARGACDALRDDWVSRCATLRVMADKVAPHR